MRTQEELEMATLAEAVIDAQDGGEGWCVFCHEYKSARRLHNAKCPVLVAERWLKARKSANND